MMKGSGNCYLCAGDLMYFYILEGESYEEYYKTLFMSKTKYSEEEFEEIICRAYAEICEKANFNKNFKRCGYDLDAENILWGKYGFNNLVEEISDLIVIYGDEIMSIGTSITPNEKTRKLYDTIDFSKIPDCNDPCKDNRRYKLRECWYGGDSDDG